MFPSWIVAKITIIILNFVINKIYYALQIIIVNNTLIVLTNDDDINNDVNDSKNSPGEDQNFILAKSFNLFSH